jgi:hypothetical protein
MLSIIFFQQGARRARELFLISLVVAIDRRRFFPRVWFCPVSFFPRVEQKMSTFRSGILRAALLDWRASSRILTHPRCVK